MHACYCMLNYVYKCCNNKAKEALGARDRAPCRRRNILDVQLPVDEVDLWVAVEGLLDGECRILH